MALNYLVGPVSERRACEAWTGPRNAGVCRAFNTTGDLDLAIDSSDSWADVLAKLPADWRPIFSCLSANSLRRKRHSLVPDCLREFESRAGARAEPSSNFRALPPVNYRVGSSRRHPNVPAA